MKLNLKASNMPEVISFEGFKLKRTQFRFKNKEEKNKFFNDALIESTLKFIRLNDQLILEKMHIMFSWYMLLRILSYVFVGLAYITLFLSLSAYVLAGLSLSSFIASTIFSKKLNTLAFGRNYVNSILESNNNEYLEKLRDNLIENNKK